MMPADIKLLPCLCGSKLTPVVSQRWRSMASSLICLRCPTCGRRGYLRSPERVDEGWNDHIRAEQQRNTKQ